jgi:hypothetical protein
MLWITPAMAANLTDELMSTEDIAATTREDAIADVGRVIASAF